jgi:hypothetical protein
MEHHLLKHILYVAQTATPLILIISMLMLILQEQTLEPVAQTLLQVQVLV